MSVISEDRAAIDAEKEQLEGRSIEDLAEENPETDEGQQLLDFGDQISLVLKGAKPTDSEIKIKAISRPIRGQLGDTNDDEIVSLLVTARLDQIAVVVKRDGDGRVAAKTRRHVFTPISVLPVEKEQADRMLGVS